MARVVYTNATNETPGLVSVFGITRKGTEVLLASRRLDGHFSCGQDGVVIKNAWNRAVLLPIRSGLVKVGAKRWRFGKHPMTKVGAFIDMTNNPRFRMRDSTQQLESVFAEAGIPYDTRNSLSMRAMAYTTARALTLLHSIAQFPYILAHTGSRRQFRL